MMLPTDLARENAELRKKTQTQAARIKELESQAQAKKPLDTKIDSHYGKEKKVDKPSLPG